MEPYFNKFPLIEYAGKTCRDITRNFRLGKDISKNPNIFYPHIITPGMRPDSLSHFYYDDSYLDWILFHSNQIIDPDYGWYLDGENFNKFVAEKYGSLRLAQSKIKNYKLNPTDGFDISVERYESIPYVLRKYYTPNYGFGARVVSYTRVDETWTVNTNQVLQWTVTSGANAFTVGELVTISNTAGYPVGNAEVFALANNTDFYVKNISGNTSPNNYVTGWSSLANVTITLTGTIQQNIPDDEYVFWFPVSYYEYEEEKNENNKHVLLIDSSHVLGISEAVRTKLAANSFVDG